MENRKNTIIGSRTELVRSVMLKCGAKAMEENDKGVLSARNESESEGQ